jgi:hypothetical protein
VLLPRVVLPDKLELAQYLEVTRTPTTAVVSRPEGWGWP